jgi:hypothetical protein
MELPAMKRIAISIAITLCGCALLYVARNGGSMSELFAEKWFIIAATSISGITIGGGIGSIFRRPTESHTSKAAPGPGS